MRLLESAPFRLALLYMVLFGGSVVVLFAFLYWSTAAYMSRQADATIRAEIDAFAERYRLTGLSGLTRLIRERLDRQPAGDSIYLLAAPDYTPLAGNLRTWPRAQPDAEGWLDLRLVNVTLRGESEVHGARALSFRLRGGYHLLVGRDMDELESIQNRLQRAMGIGLAITFLLALGGGLLLSRASQRRLAAINQAVVQIMAGDLARRLPADDSGDEVSQLVGTLNRMLERIEELIEGVRRVSDSIAHDLRTPLARLRNRLDELRRLDPDGQRRAAEEALEEADRLLATFNALQRIARIESGSRKAGFATVELAELVSDVVELYEPLAEENRQRLEAAATVEPRVWGDRDLLFQAVANLVDNALRHTPPGGTITVEVRGPAERPRLLVSDAGPGIPQAERERVFQRFYRLDRSRSSPGSGLGLSLVAAVAKLHELEVRLEDNGPGLRVVLEWPATEPGRGAASLNAEGVRA